MKRILLSVLVLLLAFSALAEKARRAPDVILQDLTGKKHKLDDFLGEEAVLLNFWATWCKPCLAELPQIEKFHKQWEERGLTLLTVCIDDPRTQKQVKPFVKRHGFRFPVYTDPNQKALRMMGGRGVPYNVLIAPDGRMLDLQMGFPPRTVERWEALLEKELPALSVPEDKSREN